MQRTSPKAGTPSSSSLENAAAKSALNDSSSCTHQQCLSQTSYASLQGIALGVKGLCRKRPGRWIRFPVTTLAYFCTYGLNFLQG